MARAGRLRASARRPDGWSLRLQPQTLAEKRGNARVVGGKRGSVRVVVAVGRAGDPLRRWGEGMCGTSSEGPGGHQRLQGCYSRLT